MGNEPWCCSDVIRSELDPQFVGRRHVVGNTVTAIFADEATGRVVLVDFNIVRIAVIAILQMKSPKTEKHYTSTNRERNRISAMQNSWTLSAEDIYRV